MSFIALSAAAALAALLIIAIITDLRAYVIPNWLNLAIALLVPFWWWGNGAGWPMIGMQLALAAGIFVLLLPLFIFNQMGGGDVKLITALALWFTPQHFFWFLMIMSIVGLAVTLIAWAEHRLRHREGRVQTPYGIAIAIGGLMMLVPTIY